MQVLHFSKLSIILLQVLQFGLRNSAQSKACLHVQIKRIVSDNKECRGRAVEKVTEQTFH